MNITFVPLVICFSFTYKRVRIRERTNEPKLAANITNELPTPEGSPEFRLSILIKPCAMGLIRINAIQTYRL